MILDKWQEEIMKEEGNILLCTGRQVGKTTIFAAKAAKEMAENDNLKIVAVSLTEDQAFLMRFMVEDYMRKHYKNWLKVPKKQKPTKNKISLNNGSTYTVRPVGNTGNAIRGFTADRLIVDEAAYMPEDMWLAAEPTLLTTGGKMWLCSTPAGKSGRFYEFFENKDGDFKVFQISSEKVITERKISENWTLEQRKAALRHLEERKRTFSELRYAQEYLGEFVDELRRYFRPEWIDRVCTIKIPEPRMYGREYFLGVDIARLGGDETAFEILRKTSQGRLVHVYHEKATKKLTTWTEDRIVQLDKIWNFRKIYIDAGAGSLGVGVLDHLQRIDSVKRKVFAANNRKIVVDKEGHKQRLLNEDLYDNLRSLGERGDLELFDNDEVRLSLRSVQYEYVTAKNKKTSLRIFGNYTHITEALHRAGIASKEKSFNMTVFSISI